MRLASGRPSGTRPADRVLLAVTSIALAAGAIAAGVIATASAAPAYASVLAAPAEGHTITITAHPRAQATTGTRADAVPAISCSITAGRPNIVRSIGLIGAVSSVFCTSNGAAISMQASLLESGIPVWTIPDTRQNTNSALIDNLLACQAGTWSSSASAVITFPPGYVVVDGQSPVHAESPPPPLRLSPSSCGGGGGGCSVHATSLAGHPAGRHPGSIVCP